MKNASQTSCHTFPLIDIGQGNYVPRAIYSTESERLSTVHNWQLISLNDVFLEHHSAKLFNFVFFTCTKQFPS